MNKNIYTQETPQRCVVDMSISDAQNEERRGFIVNRDEIASFVAIAIFLLDHAGQEDIAKLISPLLLGERQEPFSVEFRTRTHTISLEIYQD
jgi:hypothetical protein